MKNNALLAVADGSLFWGNSIGVSDCFAGEIVFNTAMTGYQEILTDPSYAHQMIAFTCPHIGNTGINDEDNESAKIWAGAVIVRDLPINYSSWRAQKSLFDFLQEQNKAAISGIDTRKLTHLLREQGNIGACLMTGQVDVDYALEQARQCKGLSGIDLTSLVTTNKVYHWQKSTWRLDQGYPNIPKQELHHDVVVYDFGVKKSILNQLVAQGCYLTVVPAHTPAEEVIKLRPNGVVLSNGPADPAACGYAIETTRQLLASNIPLFAICLGHQLLGLACGAKTVKMKHGHHGSNHPVLDIKLQQVFISSQNHNFTIDEDSLPEDLVITHRSLFDGSIQGIAHKHKPVFGFQGHPEGGPGPEDLLGLFKNFKQMMGDYHA